MKYKCIIVDDNAVERDLLELLVQKMDELEVEGIFDNGLEALRFLQQHPIDIAFSDVDMPELSGFGLLKSLRQPPVFIFISSHGRYAADSYDLDVVDFIRKPVSLERLYRAVGKAIEYLSKTRTIPATPEEEVMIVRTTEGINKLLPGSIVYAESMANYSILYLQDGASLMVLVSLKQLEEQLPQGGFLRVHKNYLINWGLAGVIRKDSVLLAGKYEVPIGDRHRKDLADRIAGHPALGRKTQK